MTAPKFYGSIDGEGRFTGYPFDGQMTAEFKKQRSRVDPISDETITWLHSGTDLAPSWVKLDGDWIPNRDVPLQAPCPLKIIYLWNDPDNAVHPASGLGRWLLGETPEGWHVLFAHLEYIGVEIDDVVPRGYPLGITGTTGKSTGIHTHAMVIEPVDGVAEWQQWAGRRDYLDYLTLNVDPDEPWPDETAASTIVEVGDETPTYNIAEWERFINAFVTQLHGGQHVADIKYGLVVKRNRDHIELDIDPSIRGG